MAKRSKWASQAQQNAVLRYSPQREALRQATQEAREQFEATLSGSESQGRLATAAIDSAQPRVQGIYDRAQATQTGAQSQLAGVLAALGPAATGFKAAGATEAAAGQGKLARERADTESGLQTQRAAAAEAPAFARTLAGQQLAKSLSKIFSTQQGIAGQEGLAASTEEQRLAREDAQARAKLAAEERKAAQDAEQFDRSQATTRRGQNLTRQSSKESHNGSGGSGIKLRTPGEQGTAATTLREIEAEARELHGPGVTRGRLYAELTKEQPGTNVPKKDAHGNVITSGTFGKPEYEKTKDIPAHDALLVEAALDSVFGYGRVSKKTLKALHDAGYSLKALRLQGPAPAKPYPAVRPAGRANERRR